MPYAREICFQPPQYDWPGILLKSNSHIHREFKVLTFLAQESLNDVAVSKKDIITTLLEKIIFPAGQF